MVGEGWSWLEPQGEPATSGDDLSFTTESGGDGGRVLFHVQSLLEQVVLKEEVKAEGLGQDLSGASEDKANSCCDGMAVVVEDVEETCLEGEGRGFVVVASAQRQSGDAGKGDA